MSEYCLSTSNMAATVKPLSKVYMAGLKASMYNKLNRFASTIPSLTNLRGECPGLDPPVFLVLLSCDWNCMAAEIEELTVFLRSEIKRMRAKSCISTTMPTACAKAEFSIIPRSLLHDSLREKKRELSSSLADEIQQWQPSSVEDVLCVIVNGDMDYSSVRGDYMKAVIVKTGKDIDLTSQLQLVQPAVVGSDLNSCILMPLTLPERNTSVAIQQIMMKSVTTQCDGCGRDDSSRRQMFAMCKQCSRVSYCSKECQKTHWSTVHRAECKKM